MSQVVDTSAKSTAVGSAQHVDELFHGHGFDGTGGIHFGAPAVISAAIGTKHWLGDAVPGAVFATVEPGVLTFRYGVGYQIYDERVYGAGAAVRIGRLTGWREALSVVRGVQYSGGEVAVSWVFGLCARVGGYRGRRGDGARASLVTIDVGVGF
jgi:hypothetical protein